MASEVEFTDAQNHYLTGKSFVRSAKLIVTHPECVDQVVIATNMSVGMLLGFAMELYLKSWLMDAGLDKVLKRANVRHNLKRLKSLCYENGLHHMQDLDLTVDFLHDRHLDHSNRYMKRGLYYRVPFRELENVFAFMDVVWVARLRLPPPPHPVAAEVQ